MMLRWAATVLLLGMVGLFLGCGGGSSASTNPNKLEYSTEGPPKRDKVPAGGGAPGAPK